MAAAHDKTTTQAGVRTDFTHTPVATPTLAEFKAHWRPSDSVSEITAMSYGGQSMTLKSYIDKVGGTSAPSVSGDDIAEVWTLENPPSGAQTVSITTTGATPTREVYALTTYTGTPLSGATGTPKTAYHDGNSENSVQITGVVSETDGLVSDVLTTQESEDHTPDGGQTERYDLSDSTLSRGCGSTKPGAASVTVGWSWTTNTRYAYIALPIKPAAAGPTAAVITEGDGTDDLNAIVEITSYDAGATSHDVYRHTATMSGDPESNGVKIAEDIDITHSFVDNEGGLEDTVQFYAIVSRDGSGDTPSNEISIRRAPWRPHVVSEGENIVTWPDMDVDTNSDGVVDGFTESGLLAHTVVFDLIEEAQRIFVQASTGAGGSSVYELLPVVAGVEYRLTVEAYLSNVVGDFKGQVKIRWFNGGFISLDEVEFTDSAFTDISVTATAPAGATSAQVRIAAVTEGAGDSGDLRVRHARFYRTDHLTENEAVISWADQTGGLRKYRAFVNGFPGGMANAGEESIHLYALTPGVPITVTVLAEGPGGELSGYSEQVVLTPEALVGEIQEAASFRVGLPFAGEVQEAASFNVKFPPGAEVITDVTSLLYLTASAGEAELDPYVGGDPIFTRLSAQYYFDSMRRYRKAILGYPGHDWVEVDGIRRAGALLEPAITQILLQSADFDSGTTEWLDGSTLDAINPVAGLIEGQSGYQHIGDGVDTAPRRRQVLETIHASGESLLVILERDEETAISHLGVRDETAGNFTCRALYDWDARMLTKVEGDDSSPVLVAKTLIPAGGGPSGGEVVALFVYAVGSNPGNVRNVYIYPIGKAASTDRAIIHYAGIVEGKKYLHSPIVTTTAFESLAVTAFSIPIGHKVSTLSGYLKFVEGGGYRENNAVAWGLGSFDGAGTQKIQLFSDGSGYRVRVDDNDGTARDAGSTLGASDLEIHKLVELAFELDVDASQIRHSIRIDGGPISVSSWWASGDIATRFAGQEMFFGSSDGISNHLRMTLLDAKLMTGAAPLQDLAVRAHRPNGELIVE